MDAISCLPGEVLGKILSLLPTHEAASTSLLSKNWRNLYRLVENLDFDDSALGLDKLEREVIRYPEFVFTSMFRNVFPESFKKFVDTTLALQGDYPIKKFSLKCHPGSSRKACVNRWISVVVERGVLELDLRITSSSQHSMSRQLCKSKTLVKLTLGTRIRLGKLPSDLSLPCLKTLFTDTVDFDKEDFSGVLLAGCPVLEELSSVHRNEFEGTPTNISSPSVKRLSLYYDCEFTFETTRQYLSLNLPNLVYLDYSDFALPNYPQVNLESLVEAKLDLGLSRVSIVPVLPDLTQVFLGIRNVKILHLSPVSAHVIYDKYRDKLPMLKLNNLVKLYFGSKRKLGWKLLPCLLKQSPNLETLIIQDLNDNICDDVLMHLNKLKVLHILSYRGSDQELRLLKSFLWNTELLELVQVDVTTKDESIIVETKRHLMIVFGDYCDIKVSKS